MGDLKDTIIINRELASSYYKNGEYSKATDTIKKVLNHFINIDELIKEVEDGIDEPAALNSEVVFLGGEQNIGCLITTTKEKVFLTKFSLGVNREFAFYQHILPIYSHHYNEDANYLSPFIKSKQIRHTNIHAIIMSKIPVEKADIEKRINEILHINSLYSSIRMKELPLIWSLEQNRYGDFILFHPNETKNPISALHSFSTIHVKEVNESLFHQLKRHLNDLQYKESVPFLSQLESIILHNKLYEKINPSVHYSIQHGDFYNHNLLQTEDQITCIDWGCARLGPVGTDIAGLLARMKMPFDIIEREYLEHSRSNHLSILDKIVFIYILIIIWFIVYDKTELDERAPTDLRKALEKMEYYMKLLEV